MAKSSTSSCNQLCGGKRVNYPFGFSDVCQFRLTCAGDGKIEFNGLAVVNITSDTLHLNLPANCSRPIGEIDRFFGENFALTSRNGLILRSCSPWSSSRSIDSSLLENRFDHKLCKDRNGERENMNYYDWNSRGGIEIVSSGDVSGIDCEFLFSSIVVHPNLEIELQTMEVAWWLRGRCRCDGNAVCSRITTTGYRCRCNEGFTGDGYRRGEGCHNGPSTSANNQKGTLGHKKKLIVAIISGIVGVILLAVSVSIYSYCHKKRRKEPIGESENFVPNLSYKTLLKATNGFSTENLIGEGFFGAVYKGFLEHQTIVAIKIFNLEHKGASKSFMSECQILRNIKHRNLVKVITACSGVDYQGNDFKALVFEYMANGSLEDWLHPKPIRSSERTNIVTWNLYLIQRLDIAINVAFVLEYLHHHCESPMVHCDLKPSNVLLDDEMVAHVGDFGLAKFVLHGITWCKEKQSGSIGVTGTSAYTPPEYCLGKKPSTQGDVHNFGILLLEIFTRKRPTDCMFTNGMSLRNFVQAAWPECVMEILDPILLKDIVGEEMNTEEHANHLNTNKSKVSLEALVSILNIALSCSATLPQERPDMRDVVAKLSSIKNKLLTSRK